MDVTFLLHSIEILLPESVALLALQKGIHVSKQDDAIPCARHQHDETLSSVEEANVPGRITSSKRGYHNVTLLALIVVCSTLVLAGNDN